MAKEAFVRRLPRRKDEYYIPGGVKVPNKEEFEIALRIFKRLSKETGTLNELRDRRYFEKASQRKRVQKELAISMQKKNNSRQRFIDGSMICGMKNVNYTAKSKPQRKSR
jgi:small subunit ribosomal protein S21